MQFQNLKTYMRYSIILTLLFITSCSVFDSENSKENYQSLPIGKIESAFNKDTTITYNFIVDKLADTTITLSDTINYSISVDKILHNKYEETTEQEEAYLQSDLILLSKEQLHISYSIEGFDYNTFLKYTYIDSADTVLYELGTDFFDSVRTNLDLTLKDQSNLSIVSFDLSNDLHQESYNRFKGGIQTDNLIWLPDSTYKPSDRRFRTYENSVLFGVYELNNQNRITNLMQSMVFIRLNEILKN